MQKALVRVLIFAVAIGLIVLLGATLIRRDNSQRVQRAQQILDALKQLKTGTSDLAVADSIAARFGNDPLAADFRGRYNKENCAASDHLERCTYIILVNNSPLQRSGQR